MSSTRLTLRVFADGEAVAAAAARLFVLATQASVRARGGCHVALAGGATPRRAYELLATPAYREQVPWHAVDLYFGDERAVGPKDAQSNFRMVSDALIRPLGLAAERVHRMRGEARPLGSAARAYEQELASSLPMQRAHRPPRFDLVLLGMGADGHTASLFPGTAALAERSRWVAANDVPQLGVQRLTLTFPVLLRARRVLFLVAGTDKAPMVSRVFDDRRESQPLPCQRVRPYHGQVQWLVDAAAASRLDR